MSLSKAIFSEALLCLDNRVMEEEASKKCTSNSNLRSNSKCELSAPEKRKCMSGQRTEKGISQSLSFDLDIMRFDEDRVRTAAHFLRGRLTPRYNLQPKSVTIPSKETNNVVLLESKINKDISTDSSLNEKVVAAREDSVESKSVEPDWSDLEDVYAKDLLPGEAGGLHKSIHFLTEVVDILIDYIRKQNDRSTKVLDFHHPHQLSEALSHCLELPATPRDLEQVLSDCKETLKYAVKTGHPRFFNQLSSGLDLIAMAGEWLSSTANTNMFTYEIAPVFLLMEEVTLQKMREEVGWPDGDGDGIFAPGGSIANLYAVLLARHNYSTEVKTKGLRSLPHLVIFTSEQAHFSVKKAAAVTGIGTENVIDVKCSYNGRMIPSELERGILKAKNEGKVPFLVSATVGNTVLGAFDPLNEIADICEKHNIWMHADAAWGGGVLLSQKHKYLAQGIHRADSVTWNPHKLMGVTLQCAAILTKKKGVLADCNSMKATYLFQKDKQYDVSYDTGDKAIQCGRHNDVFKLWLTWRSKGDKGFEDQINQLFDLCHYLQEQIVSRDGFEFVMNKPEYLNVCFWYVPKRLRSLTIHSEEFNSAIHSVAPMVKAKMMEAGTTMVGYQPLGDWPNFFRMVLSNPAATKIDVDFLLNEIEKFAEEEETETNLSEN